jgi:hypothetical protein
MPKVYLGMKWHNITILLYWSRYFFCYCQIIEWNSLHTILFDLVLYKAQVKVFGIGVDGTDLGFLDIHFGLYFSPMELSTEN